jgi:hypothetical protein
MKTDIQFNLKEKFIKRLFHNTLNFKEKGKYHIIVIVET